MNTAAECPTQARQDRTENGYYCGARSTDFLHPRQPENERDRIQQSLWDSGIRATITRLEPMIHAGAARRIYLIGRLADILLAKHELRALNLTPVCARIKRIT